MTPVEINAGVATDTSRLGTKGNLDKAGAQFEAVFVKMMLASMRKASLGDDLFQSKALDQFRDMQDAKTAEGMAAGAPIGIGRAVTEFLARSQPDLNQAAPESGG
jgi:peptidoglycan hydrolase FlgJ